jgi:hypothetical protein
MKRVWSRRGILGLGWAALEVSRSFLSASEPASPRVSKDLNLPADFISRVEARSQIDRYQSQAYPLEAELPATPYPPEAKRASERRGVIQVLRPQWSDPVRRYRRSIAPQTLPLRGYRAPILGDLTVAWPVRLTTNRPAPSLLAAADLVRTRLAHDRLLPTLARVIQDLGPSAVRTNVPGTLSTLREAGFPTDWLEFFARPGKEGEKTTSEAWVVWVAEQLNRFSLDEMVSTALAGARFRFRSSAPGFQAAGEAGEEPIGLVRTQCGGGYQQGIVPGSSLDFLGRFVEALPDARLMISLEEEYLDPVHWLASRVWSLKRRNQLTLIGEPCPVSGWAQDNGKAGVLLTEPGGARKLAVLTPRYASQGDHDSKFMPGESFLMDGLQAAGLTVIQSPLLFQGGSLLVAHDPQSRQRILLIGEAEIYRNTALGLTRDQVLEAFGLELGVDRCVVLPAGSYHLDFDVTVRTHGGRLVAFVNDPAAAARLILESGLKALEQQGVLGAAAAQATREAYQHQRNDDLASALHVALKRFQDAQGRLATSVARAFARESLDAPGANLQCFLVALDWLARNPGAGLATSPLAERQTYFAALRRLEDSLALQKQVLASLGWTVVPVPSLPDMFYGLNYVNGVHEPGRYLMPAYGGFYAAVDQVAADAFAKALDGNVTVVPLLCSDSQRSHGAIHCLVSVFPGLQPDNRAR